MALVLTEDAVAIRDLVRDFARREVAPAAAGWDGADALPDAPLRALGDLGVLSLALAEEAGGAGLGPVELALVCEELGAASAVLGHYVATLAGHLALLAAVAPDHADLASAAGGTLRLAAESAPGLTLGAAGRLDGAVDPMRLATTAVRALFILSGGERLALVDLTAPGVARDGRGGPLGLRGVDLGALHLSGVAAEDLGALAAGAGVRAQALTRIGLAAVAVGIGRAAIIEGATYATTRTQFGRPIADFQAISFKLADIATEVDAARLVLHDAASALAAAPERGEQAAGALLLAVTAATRATDEALQIHGGYGYTRDFPVERLWRDARALSALEGPPEALALEVARAALGGA